jgi:hypothetical protein
MESLPNPSPLSVRTIEIDALERLTDALRAYGAILVLDGLESTPELNNRECIIIRGLLEGRVTVSAPPYPPTSSQVGVGSAVRGECVSAVLKLLNPAPLSRDDWNPGYQRQAREPLRGLGR